MPLKTDINLLVVLGATATGKTRLGVQLAQRVGGEIISADSRQVYRGMDLGTGKDLAEYEDVPYHLIDIVNPGEEYHVFAFQRDFFEVFEKVESCGRMPIMVGGSGLYLEAVLRGYRLIEVPPDPELRAELATRSVHWLRERLLELKPRQHNTTDLTDRDRLVRAIEIAEGERAAAPLPPLPPVAPLVIGIRWPRPELRARITRRLQQRLEEGMVEEVARLHQQGVTWETMEFYGLEYRFIARYLQGELSFDQMRAQLNTAIHKFAKRQETWFRRMERQGIEILWVDGPNDPLAQTLNLLEKA